MVSRLATCACADVRISVEGEPNIVSMCHCLLCQKRTGSTYSVHAYFSKNKVTIGGLTKGYRRSSDSGRIIDSTFVQTAVSTRGWSCRTVCRYMGLTVDAVCHEGATRHRSLQRTQLAPRAKLLIYANLAGEDCLLQQALRYVRLYGI